MGYKAEKTSLESHFETEWAGATPILWDNVEDEPPSGSSWVRFVVRPGTAEQVAVAGKQYRNPGIIMVQIFVPLGEGLGSAMNFADTVVNIFRGAEVSDVNCRVPYPTIVGPDRDWFQVNVTIPFYRDA